MTDTARPRIHVHADAETLSEALADAVMAAANAAIAMRGRFDVALSGGRTPRDLHARLVARRADTDWSHWQVYFGDERCVPPDHPDSNYRMARETLLDHVPIPADQIHPMIGDRADLEDPAATAAAYAERLKSLSQRDGWPVFDLILLGLGEDGHTASLFPDSALLACTDRPTVAGYVDRLAAWRISLTLPILNHARVLYIAAAGASKAAVVARTLHGEGLDRPLPVQRLHPRGELHWHLDHAAAERVPLP